MPARTRPVVRSAFAFLLVGFLALTGIVGTTFWLGERAQHYFEEVSEARDTRIAAVELRNALQTAESGQRGFLFTGNEIYLAPYNTATAQAAKHLAALTRLLRPYPQSDHVVQRLGEIITAKLAEMEETIALKRARRDAELLALVRTNRGKALTDEANVFFSGIIRTADDRLTAGISDERRNAASLRTVSIIGGLVIVLMVGGAVATILRYARELRAARDAVGVLNAELEERVRHRTADLALANDEIRRFAYIVSHDLRAPLINVMGFTAEIEDGVGQLRALAQKPVLDADPDASPARRVAAEELPEAIGFIRSATRKMDSLINAILKLSREGRRVLNPERVSLAELVETSIGAIRHQLAEAHGEADIRIDVPPLATDRLSLEQIVGNLLDNAVKYRAAGRPLRIAIRATAAPGERVLIEVTDNGRGIAEADRERIFELFSRAGPQDQPGEGIGLAYVRTIVRNLGGDISLTSVLGEGSTFRVVLPRTLTANPAT